MSRQAPVCILSSDSECDQLGAKQSYEDADDSVVFCKVQIPAERAAKMMEVALNTIQQHKAHIAKPSRPATKMVNQKRRSAKSSQASAVFSIPVITVNGSSDSEEETVTARLKTRVNAGQASSTRSKQIWLTSALRQNQDLLSSDCASDVNSESVSSDQAIGSPHWEKWSTRVCPGCNGICDGLYSFDLLNILIGSSLLHEPVRTTLNISSRPFTLEKSAPQRDLITADFMLSIDNHLDPDFFERARDLPKLIEYRVAGEVDNAELRRMFGTEAFI